jgi:predicted RNase H-related nuclease YkuK (DUF458 family)
MNGNMHLAKEAIRNSSQETAIMIGTDSVRFKKNGIWYARYSTVIVLHIDQSRGCKLYHDTVEMPDYGSIKQRMLNEVGFAVQHGLEILDDVGTRPFAVHCDINTNPKHKSNVALKEAQGYVMGTLGVMPQFKPQSQVASHCADHIVKKGY